MDLLSGTTDPVLQDGEWPPGTRVRVKGFVGVGLTGRVVLENYLLNRIVRNERTYEVRFDDWHFPNQRYWEHELERL